jgi:excisionase family DNA binding protein
MSEPTLTLDATSIAALAEALAAATPPPDALLTADQAGALLGVPASWVLAQARKDAIPYVELGHYRRFDRAALQAWWSNSRSRGPRPTRTAA